jgi:hypothetical protein
MKNFVIVFLLAVIAFLLFDKRAAKKLEAEARQKAKTVLPTVQNLVQDVIGPGGTQPVTPNSEPFYAVNQPTGQAPMIDNPVVAVTTPSALVLSKQLVMTDTPPVYAYTPTTNRHSAFRI